MTRSGLAVRLVLVAVMAISAFAGDDLRIVRGDMKAILKVVSSEVGKNFYDPSLKGLDWPALTEEARQKIDKATSTNEMIAAIYELVEKLDDSHTVFLPPASIEEAEYGFSAKPFGERIRVYDVDPKSAAEKAGLRVGDIILQMQGFEAERATFRRLRTYTMGIYGVSPLELLIVHPGGAAPETIRVFPKMIQRPKILDRFHRYNDLWRMYTDSETYAQKHYTFHAAIKTGNVGYIDLRAFPSEGEDFLQGLAERVGTANAFIIDLRDNGGGSLETLLAFAGLFEESNVEMGTWQTRKKTEPMTIHASKFKFKGPVYLLIDSNTGSASEMFARHLQRSKKATLVGDKTAGAVTGANVFDGEVGASLPIFFGVYVGVAKVRMADGEELEKKGVTPDVACLPTQQEMAAKQDSCLDKALALAVSKANPNSAQAAK